MRISDWSSDVCSSDLCQHGLLALHRGLGDLGLELEFHPLFLEDLVRFLADIAVHAGQDLVEIFDHGDLGAKAAPHAAELEPDHAAADDDHMARNLGKFEDRKSTRLNSSH